jgi:hypothetical protein
MPCSMTLPPTQVHTSSYGYQSWRLDVQSEKLSIFTVKV